MVVDPDRFRVVVAGAGEHVCESLGPALRSLSGEGVELCALASPTAARRERAAARLGVARTFASVDESISDMHPDGIVIAAPNALHEPLTIAALQAGCHVMCEKPMALDVAGGRRMLDAARRAGRTLAIGYHLPFTQDGLRELVADGALATVFRADAHWTRADGIPPGAASWDRPGEGPGSDLLGHLLSVLALGMGTVPRTACAFAFDRFGRRRHGDAFRGHDTLEALIGYDGDAVAHALVAWASNDARPESLGVTFHGVDTSVDVGLAVADDELVASPPAVLRRDAGVPPVVGPGPAVTGATAHHRQLADWIRACRGQGRPRVDARDALVIQAVLDAVRESAARGGATVEVEEV